MNLLYTLPFREPGAEQNARTLYQQLRAGTARGVRFSLDCPYEVALVKSRSMGSGVIGSITAGNVRSGEWMVAILAMRGIIIDDAERAKTILSLEEWFAACGAEGMRGGYARPADHLKVTSELGLDYEVVESFGTFVGEPEPEKPIQAADKGLADKLSKTVLPETKALPKPPEESLRVEEIRAGQVNPPLIKSTPLQNAQSSDGCSKWLGGGMIGIGSLVGFFGLLIAGLFVLGKLVDDTGELTNEDFVMIMLCFPTPMLIVAAVFIVIGIIIIANTRKKRAAV